MKTVKDYVFKTLYQTNHLTSNAIIMMLYFMAHCDKNGRITVYHADIEQALDIGENTFYSCLARLTETEVTYTLPNGEVVKTPMLIKEPKDKHGKTDITLKIPCNDFTELPFDKANGDKNPNYTHYVNVDFEGLKAKNLKKYALTELRILLYLFFRLSKSGDVGHNELPFSTKSSAYTAIANCFKLSVQSVRKAISRLLSCGAILLNYRRWFKKVTNAEDKNYDDDIAYSLDGEITTPIYIEVTTSDVAKDDTHTKKLDDTTTTFRSDRHIVRNLLRKAKKDKSTAKQDVTDIAVIYHQYQNIAEITHRDYTSLFGQAIKIAANINTQIKASAVHRAIRVLMYG